MEIQEKIDWLSITFPHDIDNRLLLPSVARYDKPREIKSPIPVYGFAWEYLPSGIKILRSQLSRLGKHMIISGKPLDNLRDVSIEPIEPEIWDMCLELKGIIARIDFAVDVFDSPYLTPAMVQEMHLAGESDTFFARERAVVSKGNTETYYIGDPKSRHQKFRVYDKAVEQNDLTRKWIRIEFEKRKNAHNAAKRHFENKESIRAIVKSAVDFPHWSHWQKIMDVAASKRVRGKARETPDDARMKWILDSAIPAIAKEIFEDGIKNGTGIEDSAVLMQINTKLHSELEKLVRLAMGDYIHDNE